MPLLAHGIDNTPLDRSPAGTADGYTHLIVAGQTVELSFQLPGICCQLPPVQRETMKCMMSCRTQAEHTNEDGLSMNLECILKRVGGFLH